MNQTPVCEYARVQSYKAPKVYKSVSRGVVNLSVWMIRGRERRWACDEVRGRWRKNKTVAVVTLLATQVLAFSDARNARSTI